MASRKRLQYQAKVEPLINQPGPNYESPWHQPWSEPVRQKIVSRLAIALFSVTGVVGPILVPTPPSTAVASFSQVSTDIRSEYRFQYQAKTEPVFVPPTVGADTWIYPLSEPVRLKIGLSVQQQQPYAAPVLVPEIVTLDKWYEEFSQPVRQKQGLGANLQQASIQTVLDDETQIIQTYESRWHYAWSEPVRLKTGLAAASQQSIIQTPFVGEIITLDKWYQPYSDPVRQKAGFKPYQQQQYFPVLDDETQIIQNFESRWHYPWSEPVRFRQLATAHQQALIQQEPSFEVITIDKWNYAWSEPVRQKPGLRAHLHQAFIGTTLDPKTQITPTFESTWHYPWSEPVRQKIGQRPHLQAVRAAPILSDIQETGTFESRWHYPWSEPVRFKPALAVTQHPFFFAPTEIVPGPIGNITASSEVIFRKWIIYQPDTEPVFTPPPPVTSADQWEQPWSLPVRQKPGLGVQYQQFLAFVLDDETQIIQTYESRWHFPWSEPVRQKPGLGAHLQQSLIATTLDDETQIIQTYESRWHYPWSEPVRIRSQVPAGEQQFQVQSGVFPIEFITEDKWHFPWSEPVRQKPGLRASLQQALIAPVLNPETQINQNLESRWHYAWSEPVRFLRLATAHQQSHTEPPTSVFETITPDKWIYPWSEPVRQKIGQKPYLQQDFIGVVLNPETQLTNNFESRWHFAWSEPVRFRIDPKQAIALASPFIAAPILNPETQLTQDMESRWHYAWSEPVRFRQLAVSQQSSHTEPTTSVFENVTMDKWTYPWSEPVRFKPALRTNLHQFLIATTLSPETIIQGYESRWHYAWSEPVRIRPRLRDGLQQVSAFVAPPPFTDSLESRWHQPWSEPKRFKQGLGAWLQQTTSLATPPFPNFVKTINWYAPLNEPVRVKIWIHPCRVPFFWTTPEAILPDVFVTLNATEVNSDSAFFGISEYKRVHKANVSIKEIPDLRRGNLSMEELDP